MMQRPITYPLNKKMQDEHIFNSGIQIRGGHHPGNTQQTKVLQEVSKKTVGFQHTKNKYVLSKEKSNKKNAQILIALN